MWRHARREREREKVGERQRERERDWEARGAERNKQFSVTASHQIHFKCIFSDRGRGQAFHSVHQERNLARRSILQHSLSPRLPVTWSSGRKLKSCVRSSTCAGSFKCLFSCNPTWNAAYMLLMDSSATVTRIWRCFIGPRYRSHCQLVT